MSISHQFRPFNLIRLHPDYGADYDYDSHTINIIENTLPSYAIFDDTSSIRLNITTTPILTDRNTYISLNNMNFTKYNNNIGNTLIFHFTPSISGDTFTDFNTFANSTLITLYHNANFGFFLQKTAGTNPQFIWQINSEYIGGANSIITDGVGEIDYRDEIVTILRYFPEYVDVIASKQVFTIAIDTINLTTRRKIHENVRLHGLTTEQDGGQSINMFEMGRSVGVSIANTRATFHNFARFARPLQNHEVGFIFASMIDNTIYEFAPEIPTWKIADYVPTTILINAAPNTTWLAESADIRSYRVDMSTNPILNLADETQGVTLDFRINSDKLYESLGLISHDDKNRIIFNNTGPGIFSIRHELIPQIIGLSNEIISISGRLGTNTNTIKTYGIDEFTSQYAYFGSVANNIASPRLLPTWSIIGHTLPTNLTNKSGSLPSLAPNNSFIAIYDTAGDNIRITNSTNDTNIISFISPTLSRTSVLSSFDSSGNPNWSLTITRSDLNPPNENIGLRYIHAKQQKSPNEFNIYAIAAQFSDIAITASTFGTQNNIEKIAGSPPYFMNFPGFDGIRIGNFYTAFTQIIPPSGTPSITRLISSPSHIEFAEIETVSSGCYIPIIYNGGGTGQYFITDEFQTLEYTGEMPTTTYSHSYLFMNEVGNIVQKYSTLFYDTNINNEFRVVTNNFDNSQNVLFIGIIHDKNDNIGVSQLRFTPTNDIMTTILELIDPIVDVSNSETDVRRCSILRKPHSFFETYGGWEMTESSWFSNTSEINAIEIDEIHGIMYVAFKHRNNNPGSFVGPVVYNHIGGIGSNFFIPQSLLPTKFGISSSALSPPPRGNYNTLIAFDISSAYDIGLIPKWSVVIDSGDSNNSQIISLAIDISREFVYVQYQTTANSNITRIFDGITIHENVPIQNIELAGTTGQTLITFNTQYGQYINHIPLAHTGDNRITINRLHTSITGSPLNNLITNQKTLSLQPTTGNLIMTYPRIAQNSGTNEHQIRHFSTNRDTYSYKSSYYPDQSIVFVNYTLHNPTAAIIPYERNANRHITPIRKLVDTTISFGADISGLSTNNLNIIGIPTANFTNPNINYLTDISTTISIEITGNKNVGVFELHMIGDFETYTLLRRHIEIVEISENYADNIAIFNPNIETTFERDEFNRRIRRWFPAEFNLLLDNNNPISFFAANGNSGPRTINRENAFVEFDTPISLLTSTDISSFFVTTQTERNRGIIALISRNPQNISEDRNRHFITFSADNNDICGIGIGYRREFDQFGVGKYTMNTMLSPETNLQTLPRIYTSSEIHEIQQRIYAGQGKYVDAVGFIIDNNNNIELYTKQFGEIETHVQSYSELETPFNFMNEIGESYQTLIGNEKIHIGYLGFFANMTSTFIETKLSDLINGTNIIEPYNFNNVTTDDISQIFVFSGLSIVEETREIYDFGSDRMYLGFVGNRRDNLWPKSEVLLRFPVEDICGSTDILTGIRLRGNLSPNIGGTNVADVRADIFSPHPTITNAATPLAIGIPFVTNFNTEFDTYIPFWPGAQRGTTDISTGLWTITIYEIHDTDADNSLNNIPDSYIDNLQIELYRIRNQNNTYNLNIIELTDDYIKYEINNPAIGKIIPLTGRQFNIAPSPINQQYDVSLLFTIPSQYENRVFYGYSIDMNLGKSSYVTDICGVSNPAALYLTNIINDMPLFDRDVSFTNIRAIQNVRNELLTSSSRYGTYFTQFKHLNVDTESSIGIRQSRTIFDMSTVTQIIPDGIGSSYINTSGFSFTLFTANVISSDISGEIMRLPFDNVFQFIDIRTYQLGTVGPNIIQYDDGAYFSGFKFDGTIQSFANMNNSAAISIQNSITDDHTTSFWVRIPSIPVSRSVILSKMDEITNMRGFEIFIDNNGFVGAGFYETRGIDENYVLSTVGIADDKWHHIVVRKDEIIGPSFTNIATTIWIDTSECTDRNSDPINTAVNLISTNITDNYWFGISPVGTDILVANSIIDDLRIFDRALNQTEIEKLYAEGTRITTNDYVGVLDELKFYGDTLRELELAYDFREFENTYIQWYDLSSSSSSSSIPIYLERGQQYNLSGSIILREVDTNTIIDMFPNTQFNLNNNSSITNNNIVELSGNTDDLSSNIWATGNILSSSSSSSIVRTFINANVKLTNVQSTQYFPPPTITRPIDINMNVQSPPYISNIIANIPLHSPPDRFPISTQFTGGNIDVSETAFKYWSEIDKTFHFAKYFSQNAINGNIPQFGRDISSVLAGESIYIGQNNDFIAISADIFEGSTDYTITFAFTVDTGFIEAFPLFHRQYRVTTELAPYFFTIEIEGATGIIRSRSRYTDPDGTPDGINHIVVTSPNIFELGTNNHLTVVIGNQTVFPRRYETNLDICNIMPVSIFLNGTPIINTFTNSLGFIPPAIHPSSIDAICFGASGELFVTDAITPPKTFTTCPTQIGHITIYNTAFSEQESLFAYYSWIRHSILPLTAQTLGRESDRRLFSQPSTDTIDVYGNYIGLRDTSNSIIIYKHHNNHFDIFDRIILTTTAGAFQSRIGFFTDDTNNNRLLFAHIANTNPQFNFNNRREDVSFITAVYELCGNGISHTTFTGPMLYDVSTNNNGILPISSGLYFTETRGSLLADIFGSRIILTKFANNQFISRQLVINTPTPLNFPEDGFISTGFDTSSGIAVWVSHTQTQTRTLDIYDIDSTTQNIIQHIPTLSGFFTSVTDFSSERAPGRTIATTPDTLLIGYAGYDISGILYNIPRPTSTNDNYPPDISSNPGSLLGARFLSADISFIIATEYTPNINNLTQPQKITTQTFNLIHQSANIRGPKWRYADVSFNFGNIDAEITFAKVSKNILWIQIPITGEIIAQNLHGIIPWSSVNTYPIAPALGNIQNIDNLLNIPDFSSLQLIDCAFPDTVTITDYTISAETYNFCKYNLTFSSPLLGNMTNEKQFTTWFTRTEPDLSYIMNNEGVSITDDISFTTPRNIYSFISTNNLVLDNGPLNAQLFFSTSASVLIDQITGDLSLTDVGRGIITTNIGISPKFYDDQITTSFEIITREYFIFVSNFVEGGSYLYAEDHTRLFSVSYDPVTLEFTPFTITMTSPFANVIEDPGAGPIIPGTRYYRLITTDNVDLDTGRQITLDIQKDAELGYDQTNLSVTATLFKSTPQIVMEILSDREYLSPPVIVDLCETIINGKNRDISVAYVVTTTPSTGFYEVNGNILTLMSNAEIPPGGQNIIVNTTMNELGTWNQLNLSRDFDLFKTQATIEGLNPAFSIFNYTDSRDTNNNGVPELSGAGQSVAQAGNFLFVGAPDNEIVRVFRRNLADVGGETTDMSYVFFTDLSDIIPTIGDRFGEYIAVDPSFSSLVIASPGKITPGIMNGQLRIYDINHIIPDIIPNTTISIPWFASPTINGHITAIGAGNYSAITAFMGDFRTTTPPTVGSWGLVHRILRDPVIWTLKQEVIVDLSGPAMGMEQFAHGRNRMYIGDICDGSGVVHCINVFSPTTRSIIVGNQLSNVMFGESITSGQNNNICVTSRNNLNRNRISIDIFGGGEEITSIPQFESRINIASEFADKFVPSESQQSFIDISTTPGSLAISLNRTPIDTSFATPILTLINHPLQTAALFARTNAGYWSLAHVFDDISFGLLPTPIAPSPYSRKFFTAIDMCGLDFVVTDYHRSGGFATYRFDPVICLKGTLRRPIFTNSWQLTTNIVDNQGPPARLNTEFYIPPNEFATNYNYDISEVITETGKYTYLDITQSDTSGYFGFTKRSGSVIIAREQIVTSHTFSVSYEWLPFQLTEEVQISRRGPYDIFTHAPQSFSPSAIIPITTLSYEVFDPSAFIYDLEYEGNTIKFDISDGLLGNYLIRIFALSGQEVCFDAAPITHLPTTNVKGIPVIEDIRWSFSPTYINFDSISGSLSSFGRDITAAGTYWSERTDYAWLFICDGRGSQPLSRTCVMLLSGENTDTNVRAPNLRGIDRFAGIVEVSGSLIWGMKYGEFIPGRLPSIGISAEMYAIDISRQTIDQFVLQSPVIDRKLDWQHNKRFIFSTETSGIAIDPYTQRAFVIDSDEYRVYDLSGIGGGVPPLLYSDTFFPFLETNAPNSYGQMTPAKSAAANIGGIHLIAEGRAVTYTDGSSIFVRNTITHEFDYFTLPGSSSGLLNRPLKSADRGAILYNQLSTDNSAIEYVYRDVVNQYRSIIGDHDVSVMSYGNNTVEPYNSPDSYVGVTSHTRNTLNIYSARLSHMGGWPSPPHDISTTVAMFKIAANDRIEYRDMIFDRQLKTTTRGAVTAMNGDAIFWDNSGGMSIYEMREPTAGQWTTITARNRGRAPMIITPQTPSVTFLSGERWYYTQSLSGCTFTLSIPETRLLFGTSTSISFDIVRVEQRIQFDPSYNAVFPYRILPYNLNQLDTLDPPRPIAIGRTERFGQPITTTLTYAKPLPQFPHTTDLCGWFQANLRSQLRFVTETSTISNEIYRWNTTTNDPSGTSSSLFFESIPGDPEITYPYHEYDAYNLRTIYFRPRTNSSILTGGMRLRPVTAANALLASTDFTLHILLARSQMTYANYPIYCVSGDLGIGWLDNRTHIFNMPQNSPIITQVPPPPLHGFARLELYTYVFSQINGVIIRRNREIIGIQPSATFTLPSAGNIWLGGSGFGGHIAEIAIYPRVLNSITIDENENYFISRWGMQLQKSYCDLM